MNKKTFCSQPSNYRDKFTNNEEYDKAITMCENQKALSEIVFSIPSPQGAVEDFNKSAGKEIVKTFDELPAVVKNMWSAEVVNNIFIGFTEMLMSWQFWAFVLGEKVGVPILKYIVKEIVPRILQYTLAGLTKLLTVGKVGFFTSVEWIGRMSLLIKNSIREFVTPAVEFLVRTGVASVVREGIATVLGWLDAALIIMMIIDFADPCGFKPPEISDAGKWQSSQVEMNNNFGQNLMYGVSSPDVGRNIHGDMISKTTNTWPFEVDFGRSHLDGLKLSKEKEDYYANRHILYVQQYIYSLKVDSLGRAIVWDYTYQPNLTIDQKQARMLIQSLSKQVDYILADRNSVVANWLQKNGWWILIILTAIIIGVIFFLR